VDAEWQVWVRRSTAARAAQALYDVFDETGSLARQVRLPAGRSVVGFGRGTVYAGREEANGVICIERYQALPP